MAKKNTVEEPGFFKRIIQFFKDSNTKFVFGIIIAAVAVFLSFSFLSFFSSGGADQSEIDVATQAVSEVKNSTGRSGAVIASYLVNNCFGWASLLIIPLFIVLALRLMNLRRPPIVKWFIGVVFGMIWGSVFFAFILNDAMAGSFMVPGGAHGEFVVQWLTRQIGVVGVVLLLLITLIVFMVYLSRETIVWLRKIVDMPRHQKNTVDEENESDAQSQPRSQSQSQENPDNQDDALSSDMPEEAPAEEVVLELPVYSDDTSTDDKSADADDIESSFEIEINDDNDEDYDENPPIENLEMAVEQAAGDEDMGGDMIRPINPRDELSYYKPPTVDLLDKYENTTQPIDMNEQNVKKDEIVRVLRDFDIEISSIKATVGPTITLYEITPAPGVRIMKIRKLEDDIAMSLSALCIRIIAPIPGKGTIGIEVPNANKQIVPMLSLLNSRKFKETDMALPLALGKTISNEVFMVDMAKMPHLLVAGATGMGKSVGLNAIITSLLYKMHPAYLKFVMVDPKMVELSLYNVIEKHFLAKLEGEDEPIITDVSKVVRTLKSLCTEMDNRYRLLQAACVRSVKEYNEKYLNKKLLPTKGHRFMPYIVVIIDEYGDLMMTAGKEVELPIARIAQKARAVGIHMIIATQRPTTNIITGTIKANFPARMAFRVISPIDSRTILERTGANQLQGRGDMLFLAGNDPVRVQCALIETNEVERICAHIAKQQGYPSAYILPEPEEATAEGGTSSGRGESMSYDRLDPLFAEAARTVVLHQQGSTSMLQRKFNIGFNRAGRIMDQLCQTGIVGEQEGAKPRQVLCPDESDLEFRLKSLLSPNNM